MFSIGFWVGQVLPRFPIWLASIDGVCDVLCCAGVAIVGISTSAPLIMLLRPGILPLLLAGSHPCISPLRNFSHGCQCHLVVLNLWEIAPKLCLFGDPPLSPPIHTSSSLSPASCHRTLFSLVFFVHFRSNFTSHSLPHLSPSCLLQLCLSPYAFHAHEQTTRTHSIGTTGHRTTRLQGYQHSETVLLRLLLHRILRWNLLCRHRTLPPLKVPDFPDMEHE